MLEDFSMATDNQPVFGYFDEVAQILQVPLIVDEAGDTTYEPPNLDWYRHDRITDWLAPGPYWRYCNQDGPWMNWATEESLQWFAYKTTQELLN